MDPIKINVEVNLGEATIDALRQIFSAHLFVPTAQCHCESSNEPADKPQPTTVGADPEGTGAEDFGDLPADDAPDPAPKPQPTEADARNAVQAARKRGVSAATIKAFMKDCFGIATSVECPAERRQALIDGLNNLAA